MYYKLRNPPKITKSLRHFNRHQTTSVYPERTWHSSRKIFFKKILKKNAFRRNLSTTWKIMTIRQLPEGVRAKILRQHYSLGIFSKVVDSMHRAEMEKILLAYGLPKETYNNDNTKSMIHSHCRGSFARRYIRTMSIIYLDYVQRSSVEIIKVNCFALTKKKQTIFCRNRDTCKRRILFSASRKYICSIEISAE